MANIASLINTVHYNIVMSSKFVALKKKDFSINYLISDWIYFWMINILDDKCKMIWRYRSPQCVFISNHGFICCSVVIFGWKTVDLKPWSVSQLNIQSSAEFILIFPERWSETLCQQFLSGRVLPVFVQSIANTLLLVVRRPGQDEFTEGGREGQKGKEG